MPLGPLITDIEGHALTAEEREMLTHPLLGGVILFTRNYHSVAQLKTLVGEIHSLRRPRLPVITDHEGGPVQRFRDGFTALPAAAQLGRFYDDDRRAALRLARDVGWLLAAELRAAGVDHSLTPVLDLTMPGNRALADRTYHRDGEITARLAHELMGGLREGGMEATAKHFPGHGGVKEDSHDVLPVDRRPFADIYARDVLPFERMIHYGVAGVIPAHVVYEKADERPAGFSRYWLQDVLRGRLGFNGVIFSDDLSMAAAGAIGGYIERAEAALGAGCDCVLVCNNRAGAVEVIDRLKVPADPASQSRLIRMHGRGGQDDSRYDSQYPGRRRATREAIHKLNDEYPTEQSFNFQGDAAGA